MILRNPNSQYEWLNTHYKDIRLLNTLAVSYVHCATQWNPSSVESYRVHQICFFALWYLVVVALASLYHRLRTHDGQVPNSLQSKTISQFQIENPVKYPKIPQNDDLPNWSKYLGSTVWDIEKKTIIGCPQSVLSTIARCLKVY